MNVIIDKQVKDISQINTVIKEFIDISTIDNILEIEELAHALLERVNIINKEMRKQRRINLVLNKEK